MSDHLGLLGRQMQVSAWVLLGIYAALALLLLPRELRFLRDAEPSYRRRFAALDIALQLCVLLVLLPCGLVPKLTPKLMVVILSGFSGLWLVILAMSYLRYIYTYRMLAQSVSKYAGETERLLQQQREAQAEQSAGAGDARRQEDRHG
jgi:hypothetical protein